ncbi:Uncharacterised protein [Klebsiella pneumoniae]|nr:Uncharacterised protein [Klebsiella pneumoniae]
MTSVMIPDISTSKFKGANCAKALPMVMNVSII